MVDVGDNDTTNELHIVDEIKIKVFELNNNGASEPEVFSTNLVRTLLVLIS